MHSVCKQTVAVERLKTDLMSTGSPGSKAGRIVQETTVHFGAVRKPNALTKPTTHVSLVACQFSPKVIRKHIYCTPYKSCTPYKTLYCASGLEQCSGTLTWIFFLSCRSNNPVITNDKNLPRVKTKRCLSSTRFMFLRS